MSKPVNPKKKEILIVVYLSENYKLWKEFTLPNILDSNQIREEVFNRFPKFCFYDIWNYDDLMFNWSPTYKKTS